MHSNTFIELYEIKFLDFHFIDFWKSVFEYKSKKITISDIRMLYNMSDFIKNIENDQEYLVIFWCNACFSKLSDLILNIFSVKMINLLNLHWFKIWE